MVTETVGFREATQSYEWARLLTDFCGQIDQSADLTKAKGHLRNASNHLLGRHYTASVRNSERAIDAVLELFKENIAQLREKKIPEFLVQQIQEIEAELKLLGEKLKRSASFECFDELRGLRSRLESCRRAAPSDKNVPQRDRPRVPKKKSSRGKGRYSRR